MHSVVKVSVQLYSSQKSHELGAISLVTAKYGK
jgi:hypothetical protein